MSARQNRAGDRVNTLPGDRQNSPPRACPNAGKRLIYHGASLILARVPTAISNDNNPIVAACYATANVIRQPLREVSMNPLKSITGTIVVGVVLSIIIALLL